MRWEVLMRSWVRVFFLAVGPLGLSLYAAPEAPGRENVTFILGTDEDPLSPMFRFAEAYVRNEQAVHGGRLVTNLRSLLEIREYLAACPPANGRPWGLVQWVVHGNALGEMAMPLKLDGDPITVRNLKAALGRQSLSPLPDSLMDAQSEIRIHGCALGRNPELLRLVSVALGGADSERPLVRASRYYTCYRRDAGSSLPVRFLSNGWRVFYRESVRPEVGILQRQLHHVEPSLNVASALRRKTPRRLGDTFHQTAKAHFRWVLVGKRGDAVPNLSGAARVQVWLQEQEAFLRRLHEAGLEMDQMEWSARNVMRMVDGVERPAVVVEGVGEVLYLMKSLAVQPGWDDPIAYVAER